jgi:putative hydrolases of HD superfamily
MAAQPSSAAGALDFLNLVGLLKKLKRTGWVREGVHLPESVAGKQQVTCDFIFFSTLSRSLLLCILCHARLTQTDHQYRMGIMSFLITDPTIDAHRCMMVALVHDLAEALAGDITPLDGVTEVDKAELELRSLKTMLATLSAEHSASAELILSCFLEYEQGKTREALVVKDFDKFEMILQADEYERGA